MSLGSRKLEVIGQFPEPLIARQGFALVIARYGRRFPVHDLGNPLLAPAPAEPVDLLPPAAEKLKFLPGQWFPGLLRHDLCSRSDCLSDL